MELVNDFNIVAVVWNIVLSVVSGLIGFFLHVLWEAVKESRKADKELTDKVASIRELVVGEYVKKDYFDQKVDKLFDKLDALNTKMNNKADRHAFKMPVGSSNQ